MLKVYNSLTRQLEEFIPLEKGSVKMYNCGPTVYNVPHMGNYRAFLVSDLLKRVLRLLGYTVTQVMNITDIDDKIIRDSQAQHLSRAEFTQKYEKAFFEDLNTLHILPAEVYPRATEHIAEMIALIQKLLDKGIAYQGTDGSIYYNVAKFKDYGKLAHIDVSALQAGASGRVKKDEYTKEELNDFALWKSYEQSDGENYWDASFVIKKKTLVRGRPGWHIECSAMSTKYLGTHFDLHSGGIDLLFPHHENEIAQSEPATGQPFVNYWLHNEHLLVDGKKMSKSLGNFYTLRDILSKGYRALSFRYLMLATHYRQKLNFTFEGLEAAQQTVQRLQDFLDMLLSIQPMEGKKKGILVASLVKTTENTFIAALENDLDAPKALATVFEFVSAINKRKDSLTRTEAQEALAFMKNVDAVFGVLEFDKEPLPNDVAQLMKEREDARRRKDFTTADRLREALRQKGYLIEDTPTGVRWKKIL